MEPENGTPGESSSRKGPERADSNEVVTPGNVARSGASGSPVPSPTIGRSNEERGGER